MKQFDVALVGCGNISRMHVNAYRPHPERIRLVAACDPVPAQLTRAQEEYGIPLGCSSIAEMLAAAGADWEVAVVCTPTFVRKEAVAQLAAAGKHLFVEKPLADSYDEAQRIVELCDRAGVKLAVNQNFRYHYPFDEARALISAGRIGSVISIVHQELTFRQDKGWRIQADRHALSVMGIHWFDGFRWMLGDEPASIDFQLRSSPAIASVGETDAVGEILFQNGVMVSFAQSFSSLVSRTETVVIGESGTLRLNYDGLELFADGHAQTPALTWENPCRGANKPLATYNTFNQLLDAIEQGSEAPNSGHDNLNTVRMLDAAYESNAAGRPVPLAREVLA
jgi:predicted dehydrogenase